MRRTPLLLLVGTPLVLALAAREARGIWATPNLVPVERILENLEAQRDEDPSDAGAHYRVARVHALAYTKRVWSVGIWNWANADGEFEAAIEIAADAFQDRVLQEDEVDEGLLVAHLAKGLSAYGRALALDRSARTLLGRALLFETGATHADRVDLVHLVGVHEEPDAELRAVLEEHLAHLRDEASRRVLREAGPAALGVLRGSDADGAGEIAERIWLDQSLRDYAEAYALSVGDDRAGEGELIAPPWFEPLRTLVSYEAALGYSRVLLVRGDAPTEAEAELVEEMNATREHLKGRYTGPRFITPIVFGLEPEVGLDERIDTSAATCFDLDGDGRVERWSWPRANTAFLVWDPDREGRVESGRTLFGSGTWWLFFDDGYQALGALDDDRDGWVAGGELDGLAAWFDRDGDGVSDPSEVVALEDVGVAGLSTRPTGRVGRSLANEVGLVLADGRVLPTWDWVTRPVDAPPPAP